MHFKSLLIAGMALSFANAIAGPVSNSIVTQGIATLLSGVGIGLVTWIIAIWSLITLCRAEVSTSFTRTDGVLFTAVALMLLVPSAMMAWFACATLALWGYYRTPGNPVVRSVLLIFTAMAVRSPVTTLLLSTSAKTFLHIDTWLITAVLAPTSVEVLQVGNIIIGEDGHKLAVMTGCSSFTNISIGLLVWFAISQATAHRISSRAALAGCAVTVAIIAINTGRLGLMATSADLYLFFHDGYGKDLFELLLATTTLTLTFYGSGDNHAISTTSNQRYHARHREPGV